MERLVWVMLVLGLATSSAQYFKGRGDMEQIEDLNRARGMWDPSPILQSVPMLYKGVWDGMVEGPTWNAWWTQNSYGTSFTSFPFLPDTVLRWTATSQDWWFRNMADGTQEYVKHGGFAPDGTLCDNGDPHLCNYKQGDENLAIHDWTLEETLSGIVMQAEMLLITRNSTAINEYLPYFLRTSNLLESRRDHVVNLFQCGPACNLLAPSFAGTALPNGRFAQAYMTGLSVTYIAALDRIIELEKLVGAEQSRVEMYTTRRDLAKQGLDQLIEPDGNYFVRSMDVDGTLHGVVGQDRFGYFESSPNHDAVALRVVNDTMSERIYATFKSMDSVLRPNVFVLPNYPAYDDMYCGDHCTGLWKFGYWVNGGVWSTTEARALMMSARLNHIEDAFKSFRQLTSRFAYNWTMDNPLPDFGASVYQPHEDINLTIDAFGVASGLLRGLFEYVYSATSLELIPHISDSLPALSQLFPVRWGGYRIYISTCGTRSSGIANVTVNGEPLLRLRSEKGAHGFTDIKAVLSYDKMPELSREAEEAVTSPITTFSQRVDVRIVFADYSHHSDSGRLEVPIPDKATPQAVQSSNCSLAQLHPNITEHVRKCEMFNEMLSTGGLDNTLVAQQSKLLVQYAETAVNRCNMIASGQLEPLSPYLREVAAQELISHTVSELYAGLNQLIEQYRVRAEPTAAVIVDLWDSLPIR